MMKQLFESTAQAIYSVGRSGRPALTAQARPQDGEIFGEFPPRADMHLYTQGPVFVPSSTPSYMARYQPDHLAVSAGRAVQVLGQGALLDLLRATGDDHAIGYGVLLAEYLKDSCGPKVGCGQRTTLWGLQRPPLYPVSTILRLAATDKLSSFALHLLPFAVTNAKDGLVVSVAADAPAASLDAARRACDGLGVPCHVEDAAALDARRLESQPWNVIELHSAPCQVEDLPMVDHFVLRLLPMGHIKSTTEKDEDQPSQKAAVQLLAAGAPWNWQSHRRSTFTRPVCHVCPPGSCCPTMLAAFATPGGQAPALPTPRSRPLAPSQEPSALHAHAGVALAAGACGAYFGWNRRRSSRNVQRRQHSRKEEEPSHEDYDTLLMKAGLRNLLGVEENRMAQKLEEACQVSTDLKRCLQDVEVKHKIANDEVAELTTRLAAAKADNDELRSEVEELAEQVRTLKEANESIKAKNSEQWAAQKKAEDDRDKAVLELQGAKDEAAAAELKAEHQVKLAKEELSATKSELKELKELKLKLCAKTIFEDENRP
ncbi:hypothetical protein AK812_SmicGene41347 [Symbiodinium microadriaticum]|uniref:Uncharacterized protein n=1 Tax=Symbiodinium microadriaticum TaxID=2951 RepID=A0A1Q9C6B4_SYMMI|nr:hypothetical protein AK812_SmicGene41347 [Symbiodinium microadriaticum]